jgi:hypothetical protein
MKTKSDIEARVKELVCAEFDRRVIEASKRLPTRCVNNYRHPLDTRKKLEGEPNPGYNRITDKHELPVVQTIGFCMLGCNDPENWEGTICEEPIDAKKCSDFKAARGKADILPELSQDLKNTSWVKDNHPELFSLLWVLGLVQEIKIPFWKMVWFWFRRIRLEPVVPRIDTSKLLPPPTDP